LTFSTHFFSFFGGQQHLTFLHLPHFFSFFFLQGWQEELDALVSFLQDSEELEDEEHDEELEELEEHFFFFFFLQGWQEELDELVSLQELDFFLQELSDEILPDDPIEQSDLAFLHCAKKSKSELELDDSQQSDELELEEHLGLLQGSHFSEQELDEELEDELDLHLLHIYHKQKKIYFLFI